MNNLIFFFKYHLLESTNLLVIMIGTILLIYITHYLAYIIYIILYIDYTLTIVILLIIPST